MHSICSEMHPAAISSHVDNRQPINGIVSPFNTNNALFSSPFDLLLFFFYIKFTHCRLANILEGIALASVYVVCAIPTKPVLKRTAT